MTLDWTAAASVCVLQKIATRRSFEKGVDAVSGVVVTTVAVGTVVAVAAAEGAVEVRALTS